MTTQALQTGRVSFVTILHPISSAGLDALAHAARIASAACIERLTHPIPTPKDPT